MQLPDRTGQKEGMEGARTVKKVETRIGVCFGSRIWTGMLMVQQ